MADIRFQISGQLQMVLYLTLTEPDDNINLFSLILFVERDLCSFFSHKQVEYMQRNLYGIEG